MRLPADTVRAAAAGCSGGSGDEAQPHAEAGFMGRALPSEPPTSIHRCRQALQTQCARMGL